MAEQDLVTRLENFRDTLLAKIKDDQEIIAKFGGLGTTVTEYLRIDAYRKVLDTLYEACPEVKPTDYKK